MGVNPSLLGINAPRSRHDRQAPPSGRIALHIAGISLEGFSRVNRHDLCEALQRRIQFTFQQTAASPGAFTRSSNLERAMATHNLQSGASSAQVSDAIVRALTNALDAARTSSGTRAGEGKGR